VDTDLSDRDSLTTEGDLYTGSEGAIIVHSVLSPPANFDVERLAELSGGNLLTRWKHIFSSRTIAPPEILRGVRVLVTTGRTSGSWKGC
jgi:hypothetical protein